MKYENHLYEIRKRCGMSQEEVATYLNVSRQTISNWELSFSIPDLYQAKKLAKLFQVSMEELIKEDDSMNEIEQTIKNTTFENQDKVNWTKVWSKKYPVLATYKNQVDVSKYSKEIRKLLDQLSHDYQYNELDSMLVLKDILAHEWKNHNRG